MAYIIGTKRPETQEQAPTQLVSGTPSMLGQTSTGMQPQQGSAPASSFTNLQRYIEANKGNVGGLVGAIEKQRSEVEKPFTTELQRAQEAQKSATEAMKGRETASQTFTGALEKAKTAPTTLSQSDIENVRNLATTYNYNPTQVGAGLGQSLATLRQQLGTGGGVTTGLEALQTAPGQRQALLAQRQAPRSSLGGLELDTFLLGTTPGAQEQIGQLFAGRKEALTGQLSPLSTTAEQIGKTTGLTKEDIQKQLETALTGEQSAIRSAIAPSIDLTVMQESGIPQQLKAKELETELKSRPQLYDPNTAEGQKRITDLAASYFKNIGESITPEQKARYQAYANLAGITPEEQTRYLGGTGLTEEEKAKILSQFATRFIEQNKRVTPQIVGDTGQPATITSGTLSAPAGAQSLYNAPSSPPPNTFFQQTSNFGQGVTGQPLSAGYDKAINDLLQNLGLK